MPPFEASPQENISGFFQRNARLIAGAGLFVTFWMLVYTFAVYKPQYAAKSVVIIRDSAITSRYIEPDNYYALQTTSSSSSNPVLNTMGILKSGAISDALLAYFQEKHPEQLKKNKIKTKKDWERFYQDGSSFIKAKNQPGTDLIAIQFSWSDPVIAKEALSVVVEAFQNASRDLNKEEQINRTKFLNKQVIEIEAKLADIRTQKSDYQSKERTVSLKRESDDLAGSRMELSNKLNQIESHAQGKENMARRYQQLLGMDAEQALKASAIGQNSSMSKLQDELYHLQQQYSLLNSSLTETNPKVLEVQAQIDQVKANIKAEKARTVGKFLGDGEGDIVADGTRNTLITNMLQAQGEAQDLRAQAAIIRNRLSQVNRDISSFPEMAEGLANIEQKEASLSAALDQLRQKVLEGKLKEEQTLSNVFIVDAPRLPEKAQFPNRSHLIVLSVALGFGVGVAVAFGREQLVSTRRLALPEWLESIDTPADAPPQEDGQPPHYGNGNGHQPPRELPTGRQPNPQQTPAVAQTVFIPNTIESGQAERGEIPVIGSLFDSIVPVAGPMARKTPTTQAEFRSELTRPLPKPSQAKPSTVIQESAPPVEPIERRIPVIIPPQAAETALEEVTATLPTSPPPSADSLAHPLAEAVAKLEAIAPDQQAVMLTPSKTVKLAESVDTALLAKQLEHSAPQLPHTLMETVPALHAMPVMGQAVENALTPEISLVTEPEPQEPDEGYAARLAYEAQAKAMPLPKKRRGLPSFLLEGEVEETEAPYTLVSRKQLLSPDDDLMQDVAPMEAPVAAAQTEDWTEPIFAPLETFNEAFDENDENSHQAQAPLKSPIPGFMLNEPVKSGRKPLLGGSLFGKKPSRHPEVYFGLGARAKKRNEMPASLSRLMQTLGSNRVSADS